MGQLINGVWCKGTAQKNVHDWPGKRPQAVFQNLVAQDAGSSSHRLVAQSGRYHLYISYACPWAHRAILTLLWHGLDSHISVDVVNPVLDPEQGWDFATFFAKTTGDRAQGYKFLREIYCKSDPHVTSRVTVPVLWDKQTKKIISNESSEIIRIFNTVFSALSHHQDLYPAALRAEIDQMNAGIYQNINNGVYEAAFSPSQKEYEATVIRIFARLDQLERHLGSHEFLCGAQCTEADLRLWPSLLRFDAVYYSLFKCNLRRICDYPNLTNYMRKISRLSRFRTTIHFDHIKANYYNIAWPVNTSFLIPIGPDLDPAYVPQGEGTTSAHVV